MNWRRKKNRKWLWVNKPRLNSFRAKNSQRDVKLFNILNWLYINPIGCAIWPRMCVRHYTSNMSSELASIWLTLHLLWFISLSRCFFRLCLSFFLLSAEYLMQRLCMQCKCQSNNSISLGVVYVCVCSVHVWHWLQRHTVHITPTALITVYYDYIMWQASYNPPANWKSDREKHKSVFENLRHNLQ